MLRALRIVRIVRKSTAVLLAGALFCALFTSAAISTAWAHGADRKSGKTKFLKKPDAVYMILMNEPPVNHVIEMPNMFECIKAIQFSPAARCTRGVTSKVISDFKALQKSRDYLPASQPAVK